MSQTASLCHPSSVLKVAPILSVLALTSPALAEGEPASRDAMRNTPPARSLDFIFRGTSADYERLSAVRAYDERCDVLAAPVRRWLEDRLDRTTVGVSLRDDWNRRGVERARRFECGSPAGLALVREGLNPPPKPPRFWR